ncbi:choice-of-anchor M domain-containing protein [Agromyces atrinae]|uniref:choice-of-anchor M domain-containing protein n=1 Tax=Agromyces atrinae TaxID=592376 RepID=UPI001F5A9184|nr:choice-of-anchor M domain-containing protein [Agromyces atrinae]MCI2956663.1 choice-of-anchor M domain-containing protein [Agromyces atrinae]
MITHSPPRKLAALFTGLAVAAGTLLLPATAATAAEGAAPPPTDYRVISGVHTDTAATFLDDGRLTLASKADVEEGDGTRFAAADVWFHLESSAAKTIPAGYEFIGPVGSTAWIASESNPGAGALWPGFNTESIPAGAIDENRTQFTLLKVDGPGSLEVFTGGFGGVNRLWSSSDDSIHSFTIGRTHMHANWAFTATGTYRVSVEASVAVGGAVQTAEATYTFVVGDIPEPVETTTTLTASSAELLVGDPVTLTAAVTPSDVEGFLEFRNGDTVLGHETVADGTASFETSALNVGTHALTATYVPSISNTAAGSASEPVAVAVADGSGAAFGIEGVTEYRPGDTLQARVVGHTPADGQTYRWVWRIAGKTSTYVLTGTGGEEAAGRLTLPIDMSHDGYELSAQVREGRSTVAQTPWVPLTVTSDVAPLSGSLPGESVYLGDEVLFELDSTPAEGDTVRVAFRGTGGPWNSMVDSSEQIDEDTIKLKPAGQMTGFVWTLQTVRNGIVVAHSEPLAMDVLRREAHVEGVRSVYRVGQTLAASARVFPTIEGATYTWYLIRYFSESPWAEMQILSEGATEADLAVELPMQATHDGQYLTFEATLPEGHPSGARTIAFDQRALAVSDSAPDTQLLFFGSIGEHYHQGYNVNLNLIADPELADDDVISWEWKWPGTEWASLPGAAGAKHSLVAEQAMHGVEVRATVDFAESDESLTANPVTVRVDDHGSPARQIVTISGDAIDNGSASLTEGEPVSWTADVAHGTVLESFQWFRTAAGALEATPIDGATAATFELTPTLDDDGATYSVAVVKPDGSLAYGPSAPIAVSVEEGHETPVTTSVTITGLEDSYRVGDTMSLEAVQNPETGEDHWHWFLKRSGDAEFAVIPAELSSTLSREIAAEDHGAQIVARLYDHDHDLLAESTPVTVTVTDAEAPAPGKPDAAPRDRTADDLGEAPIGGIELSDSTLSPGESLTIGLGAEHALAWVAPWLFSEPTLLGGDWAEVDAEGDITVTIPAGTIEGEHRIAVYGADDSLIGWAALTVASEAPGGVTPPGEGGTPGEGTPPGVEPAPGTDPPTGNGAPSGSDTDRDILASTGTSVSLTAIALALLLTAVGALFITRRMRAPSAR